MTAGIGAVMLEDLERIAAHGLEWGMLKNSTVLISGASGFLATYMVELLLYLNKTLNQNTRVLALVRNGDKARSRFKHHEGGCDLDFLVQDVCAPIDFDALGDVDFVIHAASQASPKFYGSDPVGTTMPNVLGTANLLGLAAAKAAKTFLFVSSAEVYGETSDEQIPTTEIDYGYLDPVNARSCYGESKRMGENLCVSWWRQYGLPVKIVRPFHTYGPGMDLLDGRVFADFVSDIVHNRDIIMKSDGRNARAFCYVADVVLGIFTVLLKGKEGEAYNVGFSKDASILSLAEMLVELFPEKGLKVVKSIAERPKGYVETKIARTCPDISKIKSLGWQPITDMRTGFARTIRSYWE